MCGYGERGEAGELPRRRLSELASAMQSGAEVRQALSTPRRPRTARPRSAPRASPLNGHGERSVERRRCFQVRGEGVEICKQGRASSGIPWRALPCYDHKGGDVRS